jgi:hypothetical protein
MQDVQWVNGKMSKKNEIVIYWSNATTKKNNDQDWTLLYPKPNTLFEDLFFKKNKKLDPANYFSCPAINKKIKNTIVFKSPMTCSYHYEENKEQLVVIPTTENYIGFRQERLPVINSGPIVLFSMQYILFCEEDLDVSFTAPYFHKTEYMKSGSTVPGEFNIGSWFRPYNLEVQMWSNKGDITFKEDEPLFYAEAKTNKKIILQQFEYTDKLHDYVMACVNSTTLFGKNKTLLSRYNRFNNTGLREKVLKEIKNNLVG